MVLSWSVQVDVLRVDRWWRQFEMPEYIIYVRRFLIRVSFCTGTVAQ